MTHDLDDELAPGERLLWQGRPSGWPPLKAAGAETHAAAAIAFVLGCLVVGAALARRVPAGSVPALLVQAGLKPMGLLAVFPLAELLRGTAWRARRYGLTDRRVIVLTPLGGRRELARSEIARVVVSGDVVELHRDTTSGAILTLDGLEDAEAVAMLLDPTREDPKGS